MIYTVTFNPSLDYVVKVPGFTLGEVNRTTAEKMYPGGKGINVSLMLSHLGCQSKAFGFLAGFTGKAVEQMLKEAGCETDFIFLEEGFSRINVKIKGEKESEINGQGPVIGEKGLEKLYGKLSELTSGDTLVLAGSIPNTLPEHIYEEIMEFLKEKNICVVVDATKQLLLNVLKYEPFLIKPNRQELGELFGKQLDTEEEIIFYAKELKKTGARNVLVSMAGDGAILAAEDGNVYKDMPPKGRVVNSVGAGDSMVAGFIAGFQNTNDYEKAFRLSLAAGSASAFQEWLGKKEDVKKLLDKPETYGI